MHTLLRPKFDVMLFVIGASIFIVFFSLSSIYYPFYNWDLIPYLASALSYGISDTTELHQTTYQLLKDSMPSANFMALTSGGYSEHMYLDADDFFSQLKFYDIKPLYTFLLYGVSELGVPIVYSSAVISTGAAIFISVLLFYWISQYTSYPIAFGLSFVLVMLTRIALLARGASPDVLSALIIVFASYLLIEKKALKPAFLLLIMSIFIRANNVIFTTMVTAYYAFNMTEPKNRFRFNFYNLSLIAAVSCYFFVTLSMQAYSWWTLFYHSFIEKINNPELVDLTFDMVAYFDVLKHFAKALFITEVFMPSMVFAFVMISFFTINSSKINAKENTHLVYIIYANFFIYFLTFPSVYEWDRFFAPFYIIISMLAIIRVVTERKKLSAIGSAVTRNVV